MGFTAPQDKDRPIIENGFVNKVYQTNSIIQQKSVILSYQS